jgi:hypothetical protein
MDRDPQNYVKGFLIFMAVLLLSFSGIVFGLNARCKHETNAFLPYYPGAVEEIESHNFVKFGIGETNVLIYSTDPIEEVRNWYGRTQATAHDKIGMRIASTRYVVRRAVDRPGTDIVLASHCVQ